MGSLAELGVANVASPGCLRPCYRSFGYIAQLAERPAVNREVVGSLRKLGVASVTSPGCLRPPLYPLFQDSGGGRASASYAEGYGIPRRARSRKHGIPRMPATCSWDYYLIILIERFSNLSTTGLYTMELISNTIYMRKGISLLITWYKKRNEY